MSQNKEDIDKSVLHCTEAIFLPPLSRGGSYLNNIFKLFYHLACALLERSEVSRQFEGLKHPIEYLRYLHGLDLDPFDLPRDLVTASLTRALGTQVCFDSGDATRNIKEMLVLFRELLTIDLSAGFPEDICPHLTAAVLAESHRGRVQPLDQVIECLRDAAKMCSPDSHCVILALAAALGTRFGETHLNDDYEEAMALLERILDPNRPGECPDSIRDQASSLAAVLASARSTIFKNPAYSEASISRLRTSLSSSSVDERFRLGFASLLSADVEERFRLYSLPESLEEANSYASQVADLSSSNILDDSWAIPIVDPDPESYSTMRMAEKIQHLVELLSRTPPGTDRHNECLIHLANWCKLKSSRTNDISDIEESIKYSRLELNATHSGNQIHPLISLQDLLFDAFKQTNQTNYLDESITAGYDILRLKNARDIYFQIVRKLVVSLLVRQQFVTSERSEDRHEAVRLILMVIDNQYARESDRFQLSCQWAFLARSIRHPTTLAAYKTAMSLMQKLLSFAPTVSTQHIRLVELGWNCQTMPLDYASFQIELGQFEEAVETLEQGRALLWSEMRGLRAPAAKLMEEDPPLAKRFAIINRELEALTICITPSGKPEMGDGTDPFGLLVVKRQKLVEERDALISRIQSRPGFDRFLMASTFTALRSAASRGPVILINHCEWSSDILIVFHSRLPCSIPTANNFYARANELRDELVEARDHHGLDSDEYQDALCSALKGLYELVGEPVIKRLRVLGVPEQSRIWWCPTSVFCSLPLHAMGPIPSNDTPKRYFSDLYISSYTPSLAALIDSRKMRPQRLGIPSLLLVAQPDDSLPGVKGEIKVIQRAVKSRVTMKSLVSSEATPSSVVEGLQDSQLAHFACHGVLEAGKPFEASFKLHGGSRLTLLEIARSRLPNAEFAFLSCCHAAEITEASIADEALHLTAAMQYCGFRSVVGTMWAMADTDGRDLAESFYKSLLSGREAGVPYYERSARALRDATRKLRRKRGINLERWVNFVHYGA